MSDQTSASRPTVATVFAVLHMVFGGLGLLFGLIGMGASFSMSAINGILSILSLLISALLLVAGIFLITNKSNALDLSKYYAFGSLGLTIISAIYLIAAFGIAGFLAAIVSVLLGIIYPILILVLLVNSDAVKGYYNSL